MKKLVLKYTIINNSIKQELLKIEKDHGRLNISYKNGLKFGQFIRHFKNGNFTVIGIKYKENNKVFIWADKLCEPEKKLTKIETLKPKYSLDGVGFILDDYNINDISKLLNKKGIRPRIYTSFNNSKKYLHIWGDRIFTLSKEKREDIEYKNIKDFN